MEEVLIPSLWKSKSERFELICDNIVNAIKGYEKTKHREIIDILRKIYVLTYEQATREEKKEIMEIWKMANMGKL